MKNRKTSFYKELTALQDLKYRDFHKKLIPTVDEKTIIGVRTPVLRNFAKTIIATQPEKVNAFLDSLPHKYFEENNLHAFIIERQIDFDKTINLTENFLPHINNWATCDLFLPKTFKKHPDQTYTKIKTWLKSQHPYTVRFGIGLLMSNFLEATLFNEEHFHLILDISTKTYDEKNDYYVKMMIAWYFSVALVKQNKAAINILKSQQLPIWTHNKTIQKAIESRRIPQSEKEKLRNLKRKN